MLVKPPVATRFESILSEVADYYSAKLAEHGETARGVDWNGRESQVLRFEQLTKIIQQPVGFSLNDLGCGYGALLDYLGARHAEFAYAGCDVSKDMVDAARARHRSAAHAEFAVASVPPKTADYGVASGIFNVRMGCDDAEWFKYIEATLEVLDRTSRRGFAFNCLTTYSDPDRMSGHLYYANPGILFDLCMRRYSRNTALLHDYGLYEFTILVRKNP
jgi:SAM-dependent methyltransferase